MALLRLAQPYLPLVCWSAILIMAQTPSFRHGLPESSATDGNLSVHKCLIEHDWQILVSRPCDWMHLWHPCPKPCGRQSRANRLSCRFVLLPGRNDGPYFNDLPHTENCCLLVPKLDIKLSLHAGMDRRTNRQDSLFAQLYCPKGEAHGCAECIQIARMPPKPRRPWSLGSGDPCRNDEVFLNVMAS